MTIYLRQSTASQEVPLGYFLDSTDGNTEETGLTIANTDIKIWKSGATTLANKNSGGGTHISNGIYYVTLDATDTDTIGNLVLFVHVSGALAVKVDCIVLDEVMYDWWTGTNTPTTGGAITVTSGRVNADVTHISAAAVSTTTAQLGVNVVQAGGTAWTSGAITAASIAADAIGASELAADAVAEIADAIWDEATTGHVTAGTFGEQVKTDIDEILTDTGTTLQAEVDGIQADTEDIQSRLPAALVGGRIDSNVGAVSADSVAADNLEAAYDGTGYAHTANTYPWTAAWDTEVQSEVQDALDATLADSVPSDGTRPSVAQALYAIYQFLTERSVSGTTMTVKKPDGSTTLMTFTLNDATSPTSITRA